MGKLNFSFKKMTLENGVVFIFVPIEAKRSVISAFIKSGAQYERKKENGISHFVEHYLFRGTKNLPHFRALEELSRSINADRQAHTDYEEVYYSIKVPTRHFEKGLTVISEMLISPAFQPDWMEVEREIILQEMSTYLDNPSYTVQSDLWAELRFGNQPAGHLIMGIEETINSFSAGNLESWFRKHYVGEAVKIVVAGEDLEKFIPQLKKIFGQIKPGKAQKSFIPRENQKSPKILIRYKDTALTHLYLGVKTPFRPTDQKGYSAIILASIINSNIFLSMVGDRGLSYERWTEYVEDPSKSHLATYAGISHHRFAETVRLILAEYKKIREFGVNKKELTNEVESYTENLADLVEEEPLVVANFLGMDELFVDAIHNLEEEFKRIKAVSSDSILEVAREIFRPQNLNLAVVGPHRESKAIMNILRDF